MGFGDEELVATPVIAVGTVVVGFTGFDHGWSWMHGRLVQDNGGIVIDNNTDGGELAHDVVCLAIGMLVGCWLEVGFFSMFEFYELSSRVWGECPRRSPKTLREKAFCFLFLQHAEFIMTDGKND